ncbi:MAG: hypothetical protein LBV67_09490 [Streptococcaceae bacterium]|nr:hypothetical protein [Streptococcaceae bacterium]
MIDILFAFATSIIFILLAVAFKVAANETGTRFDRAMSVVFSSATVIYIFVKIVELTHVIA